MTPITNFWIIWDNTLPTIPAGLTSQAEEDIGTNQVPEQVIDDLYATVPSFRLISFYIEREYWELTVLREVLQYLEVRHPGRIIVGGAWDFHSGEPVGGAGSPWFVTPPELLDFMPDDKVGIRGGTFPGVVGIDDVHTAQGQAKRKFV